MPSLDARETTERLLSWYAEHGRDLPWRHTRDPYAILISEVMLAIEMGADAADIGLTIHPHPTLSETVAMAAEAFDGSLTDLYLPRKASQRKEPAR